MRLHRPVLAALALTAVLPVTAANAATGAAAAGSATSGATIATVSVGNLTVGTTTVQGHSVSLGTLSAGAQTLSPSAAPAVSFVPVTLDGVQTGAVTVTPANSPKTVGGISTGALPLNVLSATSPTATLTAATTAASRTATVAAKLGSVHVLGMPITLDGSLDVGSVTDAEHADASKMLSIKNIALPNLADLLAALGIDLAKLPVGTLEGLVAGLPVTISGATQTALDTVDSTITTTQSQLTAAQATLDAKFTALSSATTALDAALAAYSGAVPPGVVAPFDHTDWDALTTLEKTAVGTADSNVATTGAAYDTAKSEWSAADAAVNTLTGALTTAIGTLTDLVAGVLAGTPLVSIGTAQIGTRAAVDTSKAAMVTGSISGVKVMGEDVLATITGNSTLDAAKLVGDVASQVNAELASISQALSNVLSAATGATGLVVPAPSIKLLTKTTSTGVDGAFGLANVTLTALDVSLGSVTVPDAFALTGAGSLAGIAATSTGFKTAPLSVKVGAITEAARFRPASGTTPSGGGSLPATGAPYGLAAVALLGAGFATVTRRRLRLVAAEDNS
jgi:hypothetical protein